MGVAGKKLLHGRQDKQQAQHPAATVTIDVVWNVFNHKLVKQSLNRCSASKAFLSSPFPHIVDVLRGDSDVTSLPQCGENDGRSGSYSNTTQGNRCVKH